MQKEAYQPPNPSSASGQPLHVAVAGAAVDTDTVPHTTDQSSSSFSSLFRDFVQESVWPGLGLFGESYILFSIGTLRPLWEHLYPDCFGSSNNNYNAEVEQAEYVDNACSPVLLSSLTYSVVLGVMTGMMVLGYLANHLGRRKGSILTASIMTGGAWSLTLASFLFANHPVMLFRTLAVLFFIFGIGVGGEYPLSASSASERAMEDLQQHQSTTAALDDVQEQQQQQQQQQGGATTNYTDMANLPKQKAHKKSHSQTSIPDGQRYRGRKIQLVFSMQGMGIFCNAVTMTILVVITGQGEIVNDDNEPEYSNAALLRIWRITYALGASVLTYVLISRYQYLQESQVWNDDKLKRDQLERHELLQAVASNKRQKENFELEPSRIEYTVSDVSSLSAPSVSVDYHAQAIITSGLSSNPSHTPTSQATMDTEKAAMAAHQHQQQLLQHAPSTDPEDDLKASSTRLFLQNYGLRLVGASLSWLLWDVAFYGNKLFQSTFLLTLTGESTTLLEFSLAASLNAFVALLGYFGAAFLVDVVGRRNLQQIGFLITGGLFVSCGFLYFQLSSGVLVMLYLGSSFFGQLGPNATTFLIPAEIFPTEMRTMAHGICAASGKAGALMAAIIFGSLDNNLDLFLLSGYASFAACLITFGTIPETLGLDLLEVDKKWRMILEGKKGEYQGDANHPKFLSHYERARLYGHNASSHHEDLH